MISLAPYWKCPSSQPDIKFIASYYKPYMSLHSITVAWDRSSMKLPHFVRHQHKTLLFDVWIKGNKNPLQWSMQCTILRNHSCFIKSYEQIITKGYKRQGKYMWGVWCFRSWFDICIQLTKNKKLLGSNMQQYKEKKFKIKTITITCSWHKSKKERKKLW